MALPNPVVDECLRAARGGSRDALGQALEACRHYLLRIAREELDSVLQAKASPSDLVQETFLEAQRDFPKFQGRTEAELLAWLRQVLLHNLANLVRHYRATAKRQVQREVRLTSDGNGAPELADTHPTPSARLQARERQAQVEKALERLPPDYRQVILLRNQARHSFEEVGQRMNRSADAARRLWSRAIERLQEELEGADRA
jgi:RNA polymerase sigma-70 factor (ECF subfamily)